MKVIIIGLDGFTWKTIDYLKDKIHMKNLETLRESSAWGNLESTVPPVTIPAWISFATGVNPGKHGVFGFLKPKPNFDNLTPINSLDIKAPTLAQILNKQSIKSIWVNLPASTPALTSDITLGSFLSSQSNSASPQDILKFPEIRAYKLSSDLPPDKHSKEYINSIVEVSRRRFEAAKLLFQEKWKCFFILFSSSDNIQHLAFDQIKKGQYEKCENEILSVYKALDEYLGWFIKNKDEETFLVLMSDHGFESYKYGFSINTLLEKKRFARLKSGTTYISKQTEKLEEKHRKERKTINVGNIRERVKKWPIVLDSMIAVYMLFRRFIPIKKYFKLGKYGKKPVPCESIAFSPDPIGFGIYLNKKSRFKNGKIREDKEQQVKEEIMQEFLKEKSPYTNEMPFADIMPSSDVYSGPYLKEGPDILMKLKDHGPNLSSPTDHPCYKLTRNFHDKNGIFLINGPGIKPGRLPDKSIMDIAPTVLHLLGLGVPTYMDGKPILDAFEEDSEVRKREVKYYKEIADSKFSEKMKKLKLSLKKKAT